MQAPHEPYCDQAHTPRQACNDALAPEDPRRPPVEPSLPETVPESMRAEPAPEEPASSAIRDAVAVAEMPEPTPYVTREWERTAAAVADPDARAEQATRRSGSPGRTILPLAAAGMVVWVMLRVLRGR